jgi:transaldolase
MNRNPLLELEKFGQSVWLDFLSRAAIENGEIKQLIDQDGVAGLTSNPSIFEKAIADSHDYDNAIRRMARADKSIEEIYQALTIEDIQAAADLFRPTYNRLQGADGYVSLEVSPSLAHDTARTIAEARQLWKAVNRPNLMIKVPATREGLPAIRELTADGINVNITLLFGLPRYREVAESYIAGLEALAEKGGSLGQIASVASFFLSRIDVLCDPVLEKFRMEGGPIAEIASDTHGQVAIASAKVAYQMYKEIFGTDRFKKLSLQGARTQRLLWASTGTKNPAYSDTKYVETLIGQDTINTMPPATLDAYRDHGKPALTLEDDTAAAYRVMDGLRLVGIDLDEITQKLEDDGVSKFIKAFDQLMDALREKRAASFQTPVS